MEDNREDRFVAETMKKLYGKREEGLDEFKIGSHKKGGCTICYEGGVQAIGSYKGGVKIYKKPDQNDAIHIDIGSHNNNKGRVAGSGKKKKCESSESEYESDDEMIGGGLYDRPIGGGKLIPKSDLPSSSMAGGQKPKRKISDKMARRMNLVKDIMNKRGVKMIEASKIIKAENIKY
jgi:hypothetical protein